MEIDNFGMGWLPDYPDIRDYTFKSRELMAKKEIHSLVSPTGLGDTDKADLPDQAPSRRSGGLRNPVAPEDRQMVAASWRKARRSGTLGRRRRR